MKLAAELICTFLFSGIIVSYYINVDFLAVPNIMIYLNVGLLCSTSYFHHVSVHISTST